MRGRGVCGPLFLALLFAVLACLVFTSLAAVLVLRGEVPIYAPRLTGVEPHPGFAFRPTTPITLTFDQPMDTASVEAAFSLHPAVAGTFEWSADRTQATFVPSGAGYGLDARYTACLAAGARAGTFPRTTARAVEWSFSLPPLLRSSSPVPGAADVGAGPTLQAEFHYPLDCRRTLRTFVMEPDTRGLLECEGQTVVFSPTLPLLPGREYTAILAHTFLEGDPEPRPGVRWQFQTAAPLTIEEVDPVPQALVPDYWLPVRILFNRPIVAGSLRSRFALLGDDGEGLSGQMSWEADGAAFVFQPDRPLRPDARYQVKLEAGVRDELGFVLAQPLELEFTTLGLLGLPEPMPGSEGVSLDTGLRIPFTQPMDRASVEAGLAFTPTLAGEVTWEGNTLVFVPRGGFAPETSYTVRLSPEIRDGSGVPLAERRQWPFATEPFLLGSDVPSGQAMSRLQQPLALSFALPMDAGSVSAALSISPTTPGELLWSDGGRQAIFQPQPGWQSGAAYEVTLAATARAADGLQSLGQEVVWRFATTAVEVGFGSGANVQVMDAAGPRAFQVVLRGADLADFRLYSLTQAQLLERYAAGFPGIGWQEPAISPTLPLTPTVTWREVVAPLGEGTSFVDWTPAEGHLPADLPQGLYLLSGGSEPLEVSAEASSQLLVVLTRHTLVLKRALAGSGSQSRAQVLAWDTELGSGAPVVSATVQLYDREGNILAEGATDADGLLALDVPGDPGPLLALADAGGDVSLCGLGDEWSDGGGGWVAPAARQLYNTYGYTDRAVYHPGQQVHFKAWVRADDDVSYTLPAPDLPVTVRLRDARDNVAATQVLTPTAFGTISGTFPLADETMLGTWCLETDVAGTVTRQPLRVEEARKADYQVRVRTPQEAYVPGEMISVTVESSYAAGQPVAGAEVVLRVYPAHGDEASGEGAGGFGSPLLSEMGQTDARGVWTLALPTDGLFDPGGSEDRLLLALEATVADGSGQAVSSYELVTLHAAGRGISLFLERRGYSPDQEISFSARLHDLDGDPVPGAELAARILGWDEEEVASGTATTDGEGRGHFAVTLAEQGWYRLVVTGTGASGRPIAVEERLWVYDPEGQAPRYRGQWAMEGDLSISADRSIYAAGDEARLWVQTATPGPALLTLERGETRYAEPITLVLGTNLITVPVPPDYAPNIHVAVSQFGAPDPEARESQLNLPDAGLRVARAELLVPMPGRRLSVTLEADRETYAPGDEAVLHLRVGDAAGQPVTAEVSLAIVDEATHALVEEASEDPFAAFYAPRPSLVGTFHSLQPTRRLAAGGEGGGDEKRTTQGPRRDFPGTAYWAPAVVTGENGEAVVRLELPEYLAGWRVLARAITTDTLVGQATARLVTSQDLVLHPILPRFVVAGDALTLTAQIQNTASEPVSATVSLALEGLAPADGIGNTTQFVHVPAGGSALVRWPAVAEAPLAPLEQGAGQALASLSAIATRRGTRLVGRDAVEVALPVYLPSLPEVTAFAGELAPARASETLTLTVPADALPGLSRLQIDLAPSLASVLLEGARSLAGHPPGSVEGATSQVLSSAVVGRALRELDLGGELGEADLSATVTLGLQRLYGYQHEDGGWGWWYDDETSLEQTAYVLLGLARTGQAGFEVDKGVVERGSAWLHRLLPAADPAAQAFGAYVLATVGQPLTATLDVTQALTLDPFSQAAQALALSAAGEEEAAALLLERLRESAVHGGATTHWQGNEGDYGRSMGSEARTTALVVEALARIDPDLTAPIPPAGGEGSPQERALLPRAVRWLMEQRQGSGWGDTQRTGYALLALSDYLLASRELGTGGSYQVFVGDLLWAEGELAPEDEGDRLVMDLGQNLTPARLLPGENLVRLVLGTGEGSPAGQLYYAATWQVRGSLSGDEVPALEKQERSIALEREYRLPGSDTAQTSFQRGDLVEVTLTLDVPAESWYVIVEDRLPAGLEALHERLGTTSHLAAAGEEAVYFWQESGYNRKQVQGERVTFFATRWEPGQHVVRYLARAVTAGDFLALPAQACLMYEPGVWGRSAGSRLQIGTR